MIRAFVSLVAVASAHAVMPPEQVEFFEKKVRPVLAEQCYKCHGPEKQKADLRLDSREAVLKGADTGPVLVPGDPGKSSLIKSIRHEGDSPMPEKAPKMPDDQIQALTEWVKIGAPWPEGTKPTGTAALVQTHWSFQPVANPPAPKTKNEAWANSDLDRFILAQLEAKQLSPSPIADRYTLIRRATFVLTGLPPTADEVEAFEKDPAPTRDALAKVIDRLLASPRYGEHWGRHWLDVARYADHRGYLAGNDSREYPFAWTYRDWVIRSLNEDLPYDQFITKQLAADMPGSGGSKDDLAALGFLTLGRRFLNNQNDIIDDRMDVTIRGTMSLTVGCARCHDHKFDPVSAKDYYALYGVFASTNEEQDPGKLPELPGGKTSEGYEKLRAERLADIRKFDEKVANQLAAMLQIASGTPTVLPPEAIESLGKRRGQLTRKYRDERRKLDAKLAQAELNPGAPPRAHVLTDKPDPVTPRVFIRGNPGRPGEKVDRRFFSFLGGEAKPFKQGSGRLELAQAIVSPTNPLTARVIVNRVWNYQFGAGLVRTPGDFGAKSEPPTHPELLDSLATKFMKDGWSLKKLHREIMLSSTWMQASESRADGQKIDPENRLLWRQNRQRLSWEALHDALLAAAGELDETMFGRPVQIFKQPFPKRRAIYGYIDRQNLPGTLRTFDFASPDLMNPQRATTTVPQQALYMLNSPFVLAQAAALVSEPEFASSAIEEAHVQSLYERVFGRRATANEVAMAIAYVKGASSEERDTPLPLWQYGRGQYDGATQRMVFNSLPHWTGNAWQGGPKLPDPQTGWVTLNAEGGHPSAKEAAVKRFIAPRDMVVTLNGRVHRNAEVGNGVLARLVSSRQGQLAEWIIEPKQSVASPVTSIELRAGETLDFAVESRGDENSDSFVWRATLRAADGTEYSSQAQFHGPTPNEKPLTAWERYAQALLATNEFVFVD